MKAKCIRCGKVKKCRINNGNKYGYQRICDSCNNEQYREYYQRNSSYKREYQRLYYFDKKQAHEFSEKRKLHKKVYRKLLQDDKRKILKELKEKFSEQPAEKLKLLFGVKE